MIQRYCFSKRERYGDQGGVYITIETEDNQEDTQKFAEELSELIASLPITGVNVQILDLYQTAKYSAPKPQ